MNFNSTDIRYMQYALQIAKMGQGETWPNPAVGCVIVSNLDSKKKNLQLLGQVIQARVGCHTQKSWQ